MTTAIQEREIRRVLFEAKYILAQCKGYIGKVSADRGDGAPHLLESIELSMNDIRDALNQRDAQ